MKYLTTLAIWMMATSAEASECLGGSELAHEIITKKVQAVAEKKAGRFFYERPDGNICLFAKNKSSEDVVTKADITTAAWIHLKERAVNAGEVIPAKSILGTWRNGENAEISFSITAKQLLSVKGFTQFENAAGSISVGEFSGTINLAALGQGGVRISSIGLDGADSNDACYLNIKLIGKLLIVLDSGEILGACGGYGATFSGVYSK
jgi:hypothetical protein